MELVNTVLAMLHAGSRAAWCRPRAPWGRAAISAPCRISSARPAWATGRYVVDARRARPDDSSLRRPSRARATGCGSRGRAGPVTLPSPAIKKALALINGATVSTAVLALATRKDAETLVGNSGRRGSAIARGCVRLRSCFRSSESTRRAGMPASDSSAARIRDLVESAVAWLTPPARCRTPTRYAVRRWFTAALVTRWFSYAASSRPKSTPPPTTRCSLAPASLRATTDPWDHRFHANWPAGYDGRQRSSFLCWQFSWPTDRHGGGFPGHRDIGAGQHVSERRYAAPSRPAFTTAICRQTSSLAAVSTLAACCCNTPPLRW